MTGASPGPLPIVLWMIGFVAAGAPFVYLIWEFINHALSGHFVASEGGLAILGVIGVVAVLRAVATRAARWDAD